MAVYTERVQTVLTPEQLERLLRLADESKKPVSVLIREAVELTYFEAIDRQYRQQALDRLLKLDAPVADWPQMETEILLGATSE